MSRKYNTLILRGGSCGAVLEGVSIKFLDHPGSAGTGAATPPSGGDFALLVLRCIHTIQNRVYSERNLGDYGATTISSAVPRTPSVPREINR